VTDIDDIAAVDVLRGRVRFHHIGAHRAGPERMTASARDTEPPWWRGHAPWGMACIVLLVAVVIAPMIAGYVWAPKDERFTGAPTYAEDTAQHEAWADQMAHHIWFRNVLTAEEEPRGWFIDPYDAGLGLLERATGLGYPVVSALMTLLSAPFLAAGLMTLARRGGIKGRNLQAGLAVLALVSGSYAPLFMGTGFYSPTAYGDEATPVFHGQFQFLAVAVFALVALSGESRSRDPVQPFRRAGLVLMFLGAIYPFFVPVLCMAGGLFAVVRGRVLGWRVAVRAAAWLVCLAAPPMLYYAVLPHIDADYGHFASGNYLPIMSPVTVVVNLGLGLGAYLGLKRLLAGSRAAQVIGCLAIALVVSLYAPWYPWRSHLFYLVPILVVGAGVAWWPRLRVSSAIARWGVVLAAIASVASLPYYYRRSVAGVLQVRPPAYLTIGDVRAIQWLAHDHGDGVVLARSDISPWIAAWARHRVLVGHWLWTYDYQQRVAEVDQVFAGRDPAMLIARFDVRWVLIDTNRGVPRWARTVASVKTFGTAVILRASDIDRGGPAA